MPTAPVTATNSPPSASSVKLTPDNGRKPCHTTENGEPVSTATPAASPAAPVSAVPVPGHRPGHHQRVRMPGRGDQPRPVPLGVVHRPERGADLHLAPVARAGIHMPYLHRAAQDGGGVRPLSRRPFRRRLGYPPGPPDLAHQTQHLPLLHQDCPACRSSSSSIWPDSTPVRMRRATASNSATCGLVSE